MKPHMAFAGKAANEPIIMVKTMTREAYDTGRLDALALRLFDVAAQVRRLSLSAHSTGLEQVELHDRKALEWIEKLERWVVGAESDLDRQAKLLAASSKAKQFR
jgi:hypothetical protein